MVYIIWWNVIQWNLTASVAKFILNSQRIYFISPPSIALLYYIFWYCFGFMLYTFLLYLNVMCFVCILCVQSVGTQTHKNYTNNSISIKQ